MTRIVATNKEERLSICRECPFYNIAKLKCTKCGCAMQYKAHFKMFSCPMGKWGKGCEVE